MGIFFCKRNSGLRVTCNYCRQVINALIEAAQNRDIKVVRARIEAGDNIEATDSFGQTALHGVVKNKSFQIVKLLVNAGANVNTLDKDGETPLQIGEKSDNAKIID